MQININDFQQPPCVLYASNQVSHINKSLERSFTDPSAAEHFYMIFIFIYNFYIECILYRKYV